MSVVREIQQPGDVVYTISEDGVVRTFIVGSDGVPAEISVTEALRAEE